ncbi:MAG: ABC transporter ATP-binding protein [SAR324 cluster bacterium]|jgi:branched-chain amino acid transport system ATP-binding protein|nr:ABC transporter ATP-binding protein [SAR324 cluster bacterium]|tara:strand:- start:447 stop:1151 length:705 start_codon:yes stop_codon:yes gene_type:complete
MLELNNLTAGYGSFQALFSVNLEVKVGEAIAVIGPNGAGKTTLLRTISGMLPVQSGNLSMEGTSLKDVPPYRIIDLGIAHVPENRRLFPSMSIEDNLRMGAFTPNARPHYEERLDFIFNLFPRLKERRSQIAGTLSGGEQQMCAIGRALMSGPKLLLMDEPSAGLAPVIVNQVFQLVQQIRDQGVTVLIVEQNIEQVLQIVDRAYLMEVGAIKISGKAGELIQSESLRKAYVGL